MQEHVIVESSFSAIINAPIESIDIPAWCFSLPDHEYQGCPPAHFAAGANVIGLIAHTCVAGTVRSAAELGYQVTVVKDATASYSDEHMRAALDIAQPNYASAIVTTSEVTDAIDHSTD